MKKLISLVSLTMILAVNSYAQTAKVVLVKGDKYEQTTTTAVNSVAAVMGQEVESTANTTTIEKIEVKSTSKKEINVTYIITRMIVTGSAMGQEMNYDSDKKDNTGPGAEEMGNEIGKVKNVTLDASGNVLKEDGGESVGANPMETVAESTAKTLINPDFIGKELKPGTSWPHTFTTTDSSLKTTTTGNYTVTNVDAQSHIAVIEFKGTQTGTGSMEQMGMEMGMKFNNNITIEYQLDMNTGIILENKTTSKGTMDIEAGGMSIPTTTNTTVTVKITKL